MNIKLVALETSRYINKLSGDNEKKKHSGITHLHVMVEKICSGEVSGEKAHRWLGWIQAIIYGYSEIALEVFQEINSNKELEDKQCTYCGIERERKRLSTTHHKWCPVCERTII